MARKCKCQFCGKPLTTDTAYLHVHKTKTGNEQNKYYCSKEEFEEMEREKELYRSCQYLTDAIFGFVCTNNIRNKELEELHAAGYTWQEIFRCIKAKADYIKGMIKLNNIDNDYQMIRYTMTVIKNEIYNFTKEDKAANDWSKQVEESVDFLDLDVTESIKEETPDDVKRRLTQKEDKGNGLGDLLKKIGK